MWRILVNALLFDIAWPLCVLVDNLALVCAFTLLNLYVHLRFIANLPHEFLWVGMIWVFGVLIDGFLFSQGLMINIDGSKFPPFWLLLLWVNFAMALRYAFFFLQKNLWLAAAVGGVAGPFSYYMGAWLNGTVMFREPVVLSLAVLSLVWALFLPLVAWLARGSLFSRVGYA
ncbi:DUF2878 domain-containing protein [Microbulbifer sp. TYP-18]|uniref:DUF2878 domain-containing protein n=1 Tax=Microbulbifer sp. TYP-18 TaxID=3230024 RepID=UPI0034C5E367